tara:strand:+ start:2342 stop:3475 length:1134 start_codon:yes stop_codon:yes gene_type:complete
MFFSILLPSKDGENYISNVIKSIIDQTFEDYEIIIGDNNNSRKFAEKVLSFQSSKIKMVRSDKTLQAADSWMNCLNASSGKYIITLGDDDCILFNGLSKLESLLKKNNYPDCISVNGIGFYESGSTEDFHYPAYKINFWKYKPKYINDIFLNNKLKEKIVKEFFSFNNLLPLNMQPHIFSKKVANLVDNGLFKPPSPDSYALYSLLMKKKRWLISNEKIFAIGLSNKSFGYYWHNNKINEGMEFLGSKLDGNFLPGSKLNDYLYTVLKNLKLNQKETFNEFEINRSAYLSRQLFVCLEKSIFERKISNLIQYFKQIDKKDIYQLFLGLLNFKLYLNAFKRIFLALKQKNSLSSEVVFLNKKYNIYEFTRDEKFKKKY